VSTFGASKWTNDLVGSPSPISYVPHPFLSFTDRMTFTERFGNTLMVCFETLFMNIMYYPRQAELYDITFPDPKPKFNDILKKRCFDGVAEFSFFTKSP
jgi:glucuronosyltransferase